MLEEMLDQLRALVSFLRRRPLSIDGLVFGMACRVTPLLLMVALTVVCSTQFFGKQIHCDNVGIKVEQQFIDSYCLLHSTYVLQQPAEQREQDIFFGVGPEPAEDGEQGRVEINYYQWMWIVYLLQAFCFYLPHWLWKTMEGGRVRNLVSRADLLMDRDQSDSSEQAELVRMARYVADALGTSQPKQCSMGYMPRYLLCEALAVFNIAAQMWFLCAFLGPGYLDYGLEVLKTAFGRRWTNDTWRHQNPMSALFPRMSKCEYRRYGPSGAAETIDALCMLTLNIFNDKFLLFLWYWMVMLAAGLAFTILFYRIGETVKPAWLMEQLKKMLPKKNRPTIDQLRLLREPTRDDWFLLILIAANVDRLFLGRFLDQIVYQVRERMVEEAPPVPNQTPEEATTTNQTETVPKEAPNQMKLPEEVTSK